nr:hypothetical protein 74 [Balneolaceae bacterium]
MTDLSAIDRAKLAINPPNIVGIVNGKNVTENDISARVLRFLRDYDLELQEAISHGFIGNKRGWYCLTDSGVNFHRENLLVTLPDLENLPNVPTQAVHETGFGFIDVPESLLDVLITLDIRIEDAICQGLVRLIRGRDWAVAGELRLTPVLPLAQKIVCEERGL